MSEDASGEEVIPAPLPSVSLLNGIPDVVTDQQGLNEAIAALLQGHGPVGVDAERASGFRYGQRAYLVQFYRRDGGTWLIDPIALPDLAPLRDALADCTWILHSAGQDVPCLREVGLDPPHIFDTELAARLLGRDRVGLAPLVESELQHHLAKGHGAADWSTRPIPEDWRRYAALDVEVLPDLYDILHDDLERAGKQEWAAQEAEAVRVAPLPAPRIDPWRRTSGLHKVRGRRGLAIVRALAMSPELVLFGEITSALDPLLVGEVLDAVRELRAEGLTILMATHEMGFAREVADRVCFLDGGVVVEEGSPDHVFDAPQERRTQEFLARILG